MAAAFAGSAWAAGDPLNFNLSPLQSAGAYVTYGDAQSYALQIACTQLGGTGSTCPFYVQSSSGQIQNLTVIGVNSNGLNVNTNDFPGSMDNPYLTPETSLNPNQSNLQDWFMRTGTQTIGTGAGAVTFGATDPGGGGEWSTGGTQVGGKGDLSDAWDTKLSALMSFTKNGAPVFFFNNNQSNANGTNVTTADQTLAAWTRIWITNDTNGEVIGVWEFTNRGQAYDVVPGGGGVPSGDVGAYHVTPAVLGNAPLVEATDNKTDYVLSGGKVCFQQLGAAPALGDPIVPCSGSFSYSVDNNLGKDQAAYALVFPEMNDAIFGLLSSGADLANFTMHMDIRLGCDPAWFDNNPGAANITQACSGKRLTNGGESIFLGATPFEQRVPEPGTLALVGLAMAGLAAGRRRLAKG